VSSWSAERIGREDAPVLVAVVHGGFWRSRVEAESIRPLAAALAAAGHLVWNLEYPRVGMAEGGWPGTAEAVGEALDAALASAEGRPVAVVGHSAGGHLALWAAHGRRLAAVVALAPISDLDAAAREDLGEGAVVDFLGCEPDEDPGLYALAGPIARTPLGLPTLLVHGDADTRVPPSQSRAYAAAAAAAGDECELVELAGVDHMALIEPGGPAWQALTARLDSITEKAGG
jgi:acetyl esterase/lipase